MHHPGLPLAFQILDYFETHSANSDQLTFIDVSEAFADSYGKRQVVVKVEKGAATQFLLRLNSEHYQQNLEEFFLYTKKIKKFDNKLIIDFRIPQLAFIKNIKET
jgi:hypothetical protein